MVDFVDSEESGMPTQGERSIWTLYKWCAVIIPLGIMLSHWYIFYMFSLNTHEVLTYPKDNAMCIAWLYTLVYLVIPLMFLPATYLFRRCDLFRIPFVYFIFINVERWYYGSWFCTNEMVDSHYILIYCTICIYAIELLGLWWRHKSEFPKIVKYLFISFLLNIRDLFKSKDSRKDKYDEIMKIMESKKHDAA